MTPTNDPLERLGASVHEALQGLGEDDRARQRARLVDEADRRPARAARPLLAWGFAVAAALVLAVWALDTAPPSPRTVVAGLTMARPEPAERPAPIAPPPPVATPPKRETTVLESGRLSVESGVHRTVHAGPYLITAGPDGGFELGWDASTGVLTLDVQQGEVELTHATSHHVVLAGSSVRSTAEEFVVVRKSTARRPAPETDPPPSAPSPPWVRAAKRGEYQQAFGLAKAAGALDRLRSLGRGELKHLADATRLGGEPASSEPVLLELRRRFPRSAEGKRAAFYLGRVAERDRRFDDAAGWYRAYLETSPKGSFAAQARGRLLRVLSEHGSRSDAAAAARSYLAHHPDGAYAPLANRLSGGL